MFCINYKVIIILLIIIMSMVFFLNFECYGINTILRVAIDPSLPPYQFVDNNNYSGLHVDILNSIADKYNFIIEYVPMDNSTMCLEALDTGKVDVVLGLIKKSNSKYHRQFTDSISQSSICTIARKHIAKDIKNQMNIESYNAVFENNTIEYSFINNMKNLKYIVVSNQVRAFETLISGKADVLIGVKNSTLYQLEKLNLKEEYAIVNNYMVPIEYVMVVKDGDEELLKKLNKRINNLRISGEYEKIYNRWMYEDKYLIKELVEKIIIVSVFVIIILLLIFILNFRLNRLLKKQVDKKTKELKKINKDLENQIIETRNYNELNICIIENSPSGIIAFDKSYNIILYNQNASKVTDVKPLSIGEIILNYKFFSDILLDKKDKLFLPEYKFFSEEITFENKGKENITYRYHIYQLFDFCKNVRGAILTIEDISKEMKMREQIYEKEKNKALNQLITGIAHEVRNPLASIKTFVELIPFKRDNIKFQNQLAKYVPKEVDRVNNLIKNLIDYAKPDNRYKCIVSIKELIISSTALINHTLKNEKIILITNIEDNLNIIADSNQLKQVIINIILNGFEAMKNKLKSDLSLKKNLNMLIRSWGDESYAYIQIADQGIGMTDDEIRKSTEPFFTTKPTGTGLGMYISKQYVEENGGELTIESEKFQHTKITLKFERLI